MQMNHAPRARDSKFWKHTSQLWGPGGAPSCPLSKENVFAILGSKQYALSKLYSPERFLKHTILGGELHCFLLPGPPPPSGFHRCSS